MRFLVFFLLILLTACGASADNRDVALAPTIASTADALAVERAEYREWFFDVYSQMEEVSVDLGVLLTSAGDDLDLVNDENWRRQMELNLDLFHEIADAIDAKTPPVEYTDFHDDYRAVGVELRGASGAFAIAMDDLVFHKLDNLERGADHLLRASNLLQDLLDRESTELK